MHDTYRNVKDFATVNSLLLESKDISAAARTPNTIYLSNQAIISFSIVLDQSMFSSEISTFNCNTNENYHGRTIIIRNTNSKSITMRGQIANQYNGTIEKMNFKSLEEIVYCGIMTKWKV
mmetsp:Transcript_20197/g.18336  ORF Transcript_20197/g.18336 Transcript_20197/m.18336 type:complete len:120 (-) Transcript_20197:145-504(-)